MADEDDVRQIAATLPEAAVDVAGDGAAAAARTPTSQEESGL
jgi:hypothetical protein